MNKLFSLALCAGLLLLGMDYYKAIRHEFYQVWDTISELRGDE